jgi:hypothetical protein
LRRVAQQWHGRFDGQGSGARDEIAQVPVLGVVVVDRVPLHRLHQRFGLERSGEILDCPSL